MWGFEGDCQACGIVLSFVQETYGLLSRNESVALTAVDTCSRLAGVASARHLAVQQPEVMGQPEPSCKDRAPSKSGLMDPAIYDPVALMHCLEEGR